MEKDGKYLKPKLYQFKIDSINQEHEQEIIFKKPINKEKEKKELEKQNKKNNLNEEEGEEWRPDLDNVLIITGTNLKPKYKPNDFKVNNFNNENPFKKIDKNTPKKQKKKNYKIININNEINFNNIDNNLVDINVDKDNNEVNFKNFKLDSEYDSPKKDKNEVKVLKMNKKLNDIFETKNKQLMDKFNKIRINDEKEQILNKINLFHGKIMQNKKKKFIKKNEVDEKLASLINQDKVKELKKELNINSTKKYIENKNKIKILSKNVKNNFEILMEDKDIENNSLIESDVENLQEENNIKNIKESFIRKLYKPKKDNYIYDFKNKILENKKEKLKNIKKINNLIQVKNNLKEDITKLSKFKQADIHNKKSINYKNLDHKSKLRVNLHKIEKIKLLI